MAPQVNRTLRVANWNARGLREKKLKFEKFLFDQTLDICGVTGTKIKVSNNQIYKNYIYIHLYDTFGRKGVVLLSKRSIQFKRINLNNQDDFTQIIAAKYTIQNKTFTILCIYCGIVVHGALTILGYT
jgi:exonuclease III